jgi:hypothetical protein
VVAAHDPASAAKIDMQRLSAPVGVVHADLLGSHRQHRQAQRISGIGESGRLVQFSPARVVSHPLRDRDNKIIGVGFTRDGGDWSQSSSWAKAEGNNTMLFQFNGVVEGKSIDDVEHYLVTPTPPGFVVNLHAVPKEGRVFVRGIGVVAINGRALAQIVSKIDGVSRARGGDHGPITLVGCAAGPITGPGGLAYDFQRALHDLGAGGPVYAATTQIDIGVHTRSTTRLTVIEEGGHWNVFGKPDPRYEIRVVRDSAAAPHPLRSRLLSSKSCMGRPCRRQWRQLAWN